MYSRVRRAFLIPAVLLSLLLLFPPKTVAGTRERIIYSFVNCWGPAAPLILDEIGNFYGTTSGGFGGAGSCAFKLSPDANGGFTESQIYDFSSNGGGATGALVMDKSGNLYGTTGGGTYNGGVAYELSPLPDGTWTETLLYSFGSGSDGFGPRGNLIFDRAGDLYGTTSLGGVYDGGTIFQLSPSQNGWHETILYSFPNSIGGPDGDSPIGGVVMDRSGNLCGVTAAGGRGGGWGAVYELMRKNGGYVEHVIYSFNSYDGAVPASGLTMDISGNLYGITSFGGALDLGMVFRLTRDADGRWTEAVLHSFGNGNDGFYPVGPVVLDSAQNVYGATMSGGGSYPAFGTVYELSSQSDGSWKETILHVFDANGVDGTSPYAGVILHGMQLFGTTSSGGINDDGTVFSICSCSGNSVTTHLLRNQVAALRRH